MAQAGAVIGGAEITPGGASGRQDDERRGRDDQVTGHKVETAGVGTARPD